MAKDKSTKAEETKGKKSKAGKGGGGDYGHGLSKPGSGGNFVAKEEIGNLLLISPTGVEHDVVTSNGTSDATKAQVVVLTDGKKALKEPRVIDGALIFQKVLQGQLATAIDKREKVCGRLFEDVASQKKGQSAPYRLADPSEDDIKLAVAYLDSLYPLR